MRTQTTTTGTAAGASSATAETQSPADTSAQANQQSESGDAFERAFEADLARASGADPENDKATAKPAKGKAQAKQTRGGNSAANPNPKQSKRTEPTVEEAAAQAAAETISGEAEGATGDEPGTETEDAAGDEPAAETDEERTADESGDDENADGEDEEGADAAGQQAEAELPETIDPDRPPKGLEKVPKTVWKRIATQGRQIAELKAQVAEGGFKLNPTPANPLADVDSLNGIDQRVTSAKTVRDYVRENPDAVRDGATIRRADGSTIELTAEQVRNRLNEAEAIIEAAPEAKVRLMERQKARPWETAEAIMPGLLKPGTEAHNFAKGILTDVPEIKAKMPDWEVFLAAAARGYQQFTEERQGKAKWVRVALDKDGKVIRPNAQAKPQGDAARPKPKAPAATRPATNPAGSQRRTEADALRNLPATATHEERLDAALEAAFSR